MSLILLDRLSNGIPVAAAASPIGGAIWRDVMAEGSTLAEIAAAVPHDIMPPWFEDFGTVCVGGVPVPRAYWSRRPGENTRTLIPKVRPNEPSWVTFHPMPRGGEGGSAKSVISIVAAVALVAVGALITGGALGPAGLGLAGNLFAAGSTSAYVLAAGVTTLGRLALTLLAPPPAQEKTQNNQAPVLGSAGASGNALTPGGPVLRVAGRLKVFPAYASLPLIELNGDDETVEASYLMAGPHKIEDPRVEGAKISEIDGLQAYIDEGLSGTAASILGRYGVQRTPNFEMNGHRRDLTNPDRLRTPLQPESDLPKWRTEVSATDPDEIWLQFSWPGGMTEPTDPNEVRVMPFRLRMRVLGTETWINLPELQFRHRRAGPITKKIVIKWGAPPSPILDSAENYGAWHSFHTVPASNGANATYGPAGLGGWAAHASFVGTPTPLNATARVVRAYDGFTVYLDEAAFARGNKWEVGIIRGALIDQGNFNPSNYVGVSLGGILSYFDYISVGGNLQVPSPGTYTDTIVDRVVLSRFASVKNQPPVPVAGHAVIEIRARAINVAQFSCIASAYVPDWNGAEWTGSVTTSNPGVHLRDIMAGRFTDDPQPPDTILNGELVAFRQHCIDNGYEIAAAIDGQPWFDAMQACASVGYGRVRAGARWGIAFDRDTRLEAPTQWFSPRNSNRFTLEKPFARAPEAFRISFRNRLRDWEQDEILIWRNGLTRDEIKTIDVANAVGLDTEAAILARFEHDLKATYLRDYTVSFEVPPEGLISQMGDLITVSHLNLSRHHASARIARIETNGGGMATGLVLDNRHAEGDAASLSLAGDVGSLDDLAAQGLPLAAAIVTGDGSVVIEEIVQAGAETGRVTFFAPIDPAGIERGHLVMIGPAETVAERYLVKDVKPTRRFNMRITAIPETPELWS